MIALPASLAALLATDITYAPTGCDHDMQPYGYDSRSAMPDGLRCTRCGLDSWDARSHIQLACDAASNAKGPTFNAIVLWAVATHGREAAASIADHRAGPHAALVALSLRDPAAGERAIAAEERKARIEREREELLAKRQAEMKAHTAEAARRAEEKARIEAEAAAEKARAAAEAAELIALRAENAAMRATLADPRIVAAMDAIRVAEDDAVKRLAKIWDRDDIIARLAEFCDGRARVFTRSRADRILNHGLGLGMDNPDDDRSSIPNPSAARVFARIIAQ
jgi:hypothetical protein